MEEQQNKKIETAAFAAGCFWGVEDRFRRTKGVIDAESGYMGGHMEHPTYEDVCTDTTGHAETVRLQYDPAVVGYENLLKIFWENHDPTTPNRQGSDVGSQYRSVIFYYTPEQKAAAEQSKAALEKSKKFTRPIVTEIIPAAEFFRAEEYHQRYFEKHGQVCH